MNLNEGLKATGEVFIDVIRNGAIVEQQHIPNLVVTTGKNFIATRMTGTSQGVMSHMAIGSNSTAVVAGDTTLGTELGRVSLGSSTASGSTITYTATFPGGTGTGNVVEAGIFNASGANAGTMLCRTVFPVVSKQAADTIAVTWVVTIS
jgi:hypothetical protein